MLQLEITGDKWRDRDTLDYVRVKDNLDYVTIRDNWRDIDS